MSRAGGEPDEKLLAEAAAILGLPREKVLFETGCCPATRDRRRLAAAGAELRAAVFLKAQGFTGIRLVPPSGKLTADLMASRGGRTYAFEVRRVTSASSFSSPAGSRNPGKVLAAKVSAKLKQANALRKRGSLDAGAVILVLSGGPAAAGLARAAYEGAGSPARSHVCVLSAAAGEVWPPWGA